jgi:hypothetical protein
MRGIMLYCDHAVQPIISNATTIPIVTVLIRNAFSQEPSASRTTIRQPANSPS